MTILLSTIYADCNVRDSASTVSTLQLSGADIRSESVRRNKWSPFHSVGPAVDNVVFHGVGGDNKVAHRYCLLASNQREHKKAP